MNRSRGAVVFDNGKSIAATRLSRPFCRLLWWIDCLAAMAPSFVIFESWLSRCCCDHPLGRADLMLPLEHSARGVSFADSAEAVTRGALFGRRFD